MRLLELCQSTNNVSSYIDKITNIGGRYGRPTEHTFSKLPGHCEGGGLVYQGRRELILKDKLKANPKFVHESRVEE